MYFPFLNSTESVETLHTLPPISSKNAKKDSLLKACFFLQQRLSYNTHYKSQDDKNKHGKAVKYA